MSMAGIDINLYSPHSFRSASSSKAFESGIALSSIMQRASWSCESTFVDHYLRHVNATPASPCHTRPCGKVAKNSSHSKLDRTLAKSTEKFTSLWKQTRKIKPSSTVSVPPVPSVVQEKKKFGFWIPSSC